MSSSLYLGCIGRCSLRDLLEGSGPPQALPVRAATLGGSTRRGHFRPPWIQGPDGLSRQFLRSVAARSPHPSDHGQPPRLPGPVSRQLAGQFAGHLPSQLAPQQPVCCCLKNDMHLYSCLKLIHKFAVKTMTGGLSPARWESISISTSFHFFVHVFDRVNPCAGRGGL